MKAKVYWGDIEDREADLPGEWNGALEGIKAGRQVFELVHENGYRAFAFAGNDDEKWVIYMLWRDDDTTHPYALKVYE